MPTWQIIISFAMAACAIGCLLGICRAIEKLAKGIVSVGAEFKKMNAKLASIEAVSGDDPKRTKEQYEPGLEDIEAAISNFEKLKRIDLATKA